MLVFDSNILLYAAFKDLEMGPHCQRCLHEAQRGAVTGYVTWGVCYEFLRVSTHPSVFSSPLAAADARKFLANFLDSPSFRVLTSTPSHSDFLKLTLEEYPDLSGNVMHDLHIAVLMREHGIERICTRDRGFSRFSFLTTIDPRRMASGLQ